MKEPLYQLLNADANPMTFEEIQYLYDELRLGRVRLSPDRSQVLDEKGEVIAVRIV